MMDTNSWKEVLSQIQIETPEQGATYPQRVTRVSFRGILVTRDLQGQYIITRSGKQPLHFATIDETEAYLNEHWLLTPKPETVGEELANIREVRGRFMDLISQAKDVDCYGSTLAIAPLHITLPQFFSVGKVLHIYNCSDTDKGQIHKSPKCDGLVGVDADPEEAVIWDPIWCYEEDSELCAEPCQFPVTIMPKQRITLIAKERSSDEH